MKLTRRELVAATLASTLPAQAQGPVDMNLTTEALDKVKVPADTEPAFAFKA